MLSISLKDFSLKFETSDEVFSPKSVDLGTETLLSFIEFEQNDFILDLGCGYGLVGILASKFVGSMNAVMADIQAEAIRLSRII